MSSLKDLASLIMVPSLYKDGELHTVKPLADEDVILHPDATGNHDGNDGSTDRKSSNFTFSRGSNLAATRVDVNGLIEKGRENLLLQSNQFDTTWSNVLGGSITSGQSGYDGTNNAWKLLKGATAYRYIIQSLSVSGVYSFSLYAKADTLNQVTIFNDTGGSNPYAKFSLVDGSVVASNGLIDSSATDVGNGWWRLSATFNNTITTARIYPDFAETTTGSIYIQDAQLEAGLVATDYIETGTSAAQSGILEDMPRLDYSGGASCPALLLEPQRTNVATHSEYLNGLPKTGMTITANATTSPEGVDNASKIAYLSGQAYVTGGSGLSAGTTYTFSGFFKANDSEYIIINNAGASATNAFYNLANGTHSGGTGITTDMIDYGNGWYRLIYTFNVLYNAIRIYMSGNGSYGNYPSVGEGFFAWGFQTEQASYPTSYIPTYGTSVTRSYDSWYVDNIGQTTAYTIFIDYENLEQAESNFQDYISFQASGSTQDGLRAEGVGSEWRLYGYNISGNVAFPITGSVNKKKKAIVVSTDGIKLFEDGALTTQDLSGMTIPALGAIVSKRGTSAPYPTEIRQLYNQLVVFPTALTDSECIALTTI